MHRLAGVLLAMTAVSVSADAAPVGKERSAILDAARVPVASRLGKPIRFKVTHLEKLGEWAFLIAEMQDRGGAPLSYAGTRYADDAAHGVKSRDYVALLKAANGRWQVVEQAIGPTDVIWADWGAKHRVPAAIFPAL